jgi:hypothetical protein
MIRNDFEHTGFPICHRAPVICFFENGLTIVYNRFDLHAFLEKNGTTCRCVGIWPGKKSTDGFTLNPKSYSTLIPPPEEHKDIDSSESISVTFSSDGKFEELLYVPGNFFEDRTPILSKDIKLFEYIRKSGLIFSTSFSSPKPSK